MSCFAQIKFPPPVRLSNGKWNCSVPHWEEYRTHFDCNLLTECTDEEDERSCPYSGRCGVGYITTKRSCFFLVQTPFSGAYWTKAAKICRSRGSHLASVTTLDERNAVTRALRMRTEINDVAVGLTTAPASLPSMYVISV